MKINRKGSTLRQMAYARRIYGAEGKNKQQIALDVGYSPNVARSAVSHIESKRGFNNAIARLAADSNNLALSVMSEFKARGFEDFTNKDLVAALNAIGGAWDKFNKGLTKPEQPEDNGKNRLKTVILQRINRQVNVTSTPETIEKNPEDPIREVEVTEEEMQEMEKSAEEDLGF